MANVEQGWVLFDLMSREFGLPIRDLLQMVVLKEVVRVAGAPVDVRGVINLRGAVIPVIDLRMRLGMIGMCEESNGIFEMMNARKIDHVRWLESLEESVKEKKNFSLARDPHKCAFGKWYDSFRTENNILALHLEKFDAPHKKIHALADAVMKLVSEGQEVAALTLIANTRNRELAAMIQLFDETREVMCESVNEIVMVMQQNGKKVGIIVDSVSAVKDITPEAIDNPMANDGLTNVSFIKGVAEVDGSTKILLDQGRLLEGVGG